MDDRPDGVGVPLPTVPTGLRDAIIDLENATLCGGRFTYTIPNGESRGRPLTMWCAEPLCITQRVCTGARFVPHPQQYTSSDPGEATRYQPTPQEMVAGARWAAIRATGKDDPRSNTEIARFIGHVWQRMKAAIQRPGEWRL